MARIHARKRGCSGSTRPSATEAPDWVELTEEEIIELVVELSKQGHSTSKIGMILRDEHGIPSVKLLTKKSISLILEEKGMLGDFPEDIINLMERSLNIHKHLQKNRKDNHNRRQLNNTEAKIRRLVKYYQKKGRISKDWKYTIHRARLLVG